MKGEIKDRHNPLIYFKSNLCKRLSNSYNLPSKHYGNGPVMASNGLLPAITDTADGSPPVSIRYWYYVRLPFLAEQLQAIYGTVTGRLQHYTSERCTGEKNWISLTYSSAASRNRPDAGKVYSAERKQKVG